MVHYWTNSNKKLAISNGFLYSLIFVEFSFGGDEGDRTPGLGIANAALSQLSYIPKISSSHKENVGGAYIIACLSVKKLLI